MVSSSLKRRTWIPVASFLLAAIAGAIAIFVFARGEKALPEMPRARFGDAEIDAALQALRARTAAFSPGGDERRLVDEMRTMHLAEVAAYRGKETKERSRALLDAFRKTAVSVAEADRARFVTLGEQLAVALQDAVGAFLEVGRREGIRDAFEGPSEPLDRVIAAGGVFVFKSAERGVIGERGELRGPRLLPEVLFRKRWCGAVGIADAAGLSPIEQRAALDFSIAFTTQADERLKAIDALAALDPAYDAEVARGLVLLQAGRTADAKAVVDRAIAAGRTDRGVELLRDALP